MAVRSDVEDIVMFLNGCLRVDADAMQALVSARVRCSEKMADHETVQVGVSNGEYSVGLIGIINGYAGIYDEGPCKGWGPIVAVFDDNDKLVKFEIVNNE